MIKKAGTLSGKKKAAILLITLGSEASAEIFKHLSEEEIEQLTLEIASVNKVSSQYREEVLDEFHQMCIAQDVISEGGISYAREVLERALGGQKAMDIINRLTSTLQVKPFDFIRKTDPAQLLNYIQNEHPQTIALILAYLDPDQAAMIISALPNEKQADVAERIATMDRTSPEIIREVEKVLEMKLSSLVTQDFTSVGGIQNIVDILNLVDRGAEKTILEDLELDNPELAEEIKKRMFVFEDLVVLDDRSMQRVLREVDMKDLALALKGSSEEAGEKIFKNISSRAADTLKEDIEFMGPVRLRDVEEAQQKIVNLVRKLEEAGEIIVARGGESDLIV